MAKRQRPDPAGYDAQHIFMVAESFYATSRIMAANKNELDRNGPSSFYHHFPAVIVTNHAVSVELFLKCIAKCERGDFIPVHNLTTLFNDLSANAQSLIEQEYNKRIAVNPRIISAKSDQNNTKDFSIRAVLEDAKDAFETWRYIFEQQVKSYWVSDVAPVLRQYILDNNPTWPMLGIQSHNIQTNPPGTKSA